MDLQLGGRRALLIGAGRGLGGAAAVAMAREGACVAVVARTRDTVEDRVEACRAAGAPEAVGVAADATDAAELARAVGEAGAALGGLDILVTLVGGSHPGGTELDDAGWELALQRPLAGDPGDPAGSRSWRPPPGSGGSRRRPPSTLPPAGTRASWCTRRASGGARAAA